MLIAILLVAALNLWVALALSVDVQENVGMFFIAVGTELLFIAIIVDKFMTRNIVK